MLNAALGVPSVEEGRSSIITTTGSPGHALYGPYEPLEPGRYCVDFHLALAGPVQANRDPLCVVLDVVRNIGNDVLARTEVRLSQLRSGRNRFRVRFTIEEASKVEYRAWISGKVPLRIDEYRRVSRIDGPTGEGVAEAGEFPEPGADAPAFFKANHDLLRSFYEQSMGVSIVDDDVILRVGDINLYARSHDDLNFVGEIFEQHAYNFSLAADTCVIDIGMNIGLASLSFAAKAEVREVHSFEPFVSTYERAIDNFGLNPQLGAKISPHRVGLSDKDWSGDLLVQGHGDSGAASVVATGGDEAVFVELRDAGDALRPIVEAARARGRRVLVKVDCEGSEFAIFESLERAELMPLIDGFMVEWHAMFEARSQHTLIAPLHRAGFLIFDRSPRVGNGFFYAARLTN